MQWKGFRIALVDPAMVVGDREQNTHKPSEITGVAVQVTPVAGVKLCNETTASDCLVRSSATITATPAAESSTGTTRRGSATTVPATDKAKAIDT